MHFCQHNSLDVMDVKPGTYALVLYSSNHQNIQIGRLGKLKLQKGFYLYVGSAFGPGGIKARIKHHKRTSQNPHWHIDYLRFYTKLKENWFTYDYHHREHQWAKLLKDSLGGFIPLKGFGTSDCDCESHLFLLKGKPSYKDFQRIIRKVYPEHKIIKSIQVDNL